MAETFDELIDQAVAEMSGVPSDVTTPPGFEAALAVSPAARINFCTLWPFIKAGLEILKDLVPVYVKWIVKGAIKLGDGKCS